MHNGSLFTSVAAVFLGVGIASAMLIPHAPHQAKPKAAQAKAQPPQDDGNSGFALLGGAVAGGGVGFDDLQSQGGSRHRHLLPPTTPHFMAADGLGVTPPAAVPATDRKNWSQNFSTFGDVGQGNSVPGGGGGGDSQQVAMASPDDGSGDGSGAGSFGGGYSGGGYGGAGYGGAGTSSLASPATTPTTTSPTTPRPTRRRLSRG